jgi:predicted alpha/beta superfamily hydrolase
MQRAGDLFWIHMPARADVPSKYKIVDQKGNYSPDSWSRSFAYDNNGEYSLTKPVEGARFERWPRMTDGVVEPRAVRVFVPEDRTTHHLYVHDGQTLFDPTGPHGGWKLDQSAGSRTLVIGIDNTPARREEYTHSRDKVRGEDVGGGAPKYAKFVEETLRPFIQKQYGAPKKVGVMGASLGGLVSYYQAVAYPHAYDFVAGLSATMRWGKIGAENPTMADLFRDRPKTKTVFYLDSGGEPNGRDNYNSNRATADALAGLGYRWDEQLYHWHEPGAEHTEKAWADRVHGPLQIFEHLK